MTTARDTTIGSMYVRDEERVGAYFLRTESPIPRLEKRNRDGGEEALLRKLLAGGVPFDLVDTFEGENGTPFESRSPISLLPETPLRKIETAPEPRARGGSWDRLAVAAKPSPAAVPDEPDSVVAGAADEDDWLDFIDELEPMVSGAENATRHAYLDRLIGPMREAGVYTAEEMSNETYHKSGALSSSGLKVAAARSVDHYAEQRRNPKVSKVFDVGAVVHDLVLEGGSNFADLFVSRPDDDRGNFRKNEGKEWRDEQLAAGLRIIDAEQSADIEACTDAIFSHSEAMALLSDGEAECSYFWEEVVSGVAIPCRVRPDWHRPGLLVDLKTSRDASPEKFAKDCANYGYDSSLALYRRGIEVITGRAPEVVRVIVAETSAPYGVAVYDVDEQWLARGKAAYLAQLAVVARWLTDEPDEVWTGYPRGVLELPMPRWAKRWES